MKHLLKKSAALFAVLAICAGASAKSPLERFVENRGKELPNVISYADFYERALVAGMVGVTDTLHEKGIPIVGEGLEGAYLRKSDLLRLCEEECVPDKGWGLFLREFAVLVHRK